MKSYYPSQLESQRNSRASSKGFSRTPSKSSYTSVSTEGGMDAELHLTYSRQNGNQRSSSSSQIPVMPRQSSSSSFLSHFNRKNKTEPDNAYTYGIHSNLSQTSFDYQLEKISTRSTIDSSVSTRSQYLIKLTLTKSEIELLRYTWNVMLLNDDMDQETTSTASRIPGTFANSLQANASNGHSHHSNAKYALNSMASSLFCRQFYDNLLSMDPKLIKLFPSLHHQAVSFAGVLSFSISQLENLSSLEDFLCVLGKKHSRILGISADSFELMGEALVKTFHERFGVRFTRELETLWIRLYCYLADSILQFGIDPVMRLDYTRDEPNYANTPATTATNLFYNLEGQERLSTVPMAPSDSDSIANVSLMERGSVFTSATSILGEPLQNAKRENRISGSAPEPVLQNTKESKTKIRSNSAGRKFRKRTDCVIV